jgi:hypothetical protein
MVTLPFDPDDDFPFDGPAEAERRAGPGPDRPEPPPRPGRRSERGDADDDLGAASGPDWERVREAAWRVGQRARRHERVLHTRISQELAQELRRAADDLRVPVSNLVRNVLEEAFGAVERVSEEVGGFLEEVLSETEGARDDVRRLRRGLNRLARRGRRGARRRFGEAAADDADLDELESEEELGSDEDAFAERGALEREGRGSGRAERGASERAREPQTGDTVEPALRDAGVFRPRGAELPFAEVLGWQPLLLNAPAGCACGERALAAGEEVYAAVTERGLTRTFLCGTCMRARSGA